MVLTVEELKCGKISQEINDVIIKHSESILVLYALWYKRDPKGFLKCFLNDGSIRMVSCLLIFACKKNGMLKELEGKKDFSEWVNKQDLEEKWKPVLSKLLLILWGVVL